MPEEAKQSLREAIRLILEDRLEIADEDLRHWRFAIEFAAWVQ